MMPVGRAAEEVMPHLADQTEPSASFPFEDVFQSNFSSIHVLFFSKARLKQ